MLSLYMSCNKLSIDTITKQKLVKSVELRRLAIEILVNIIRYSNEWVIKSNKINLQYIDNNNNDKRNSIKLMIQNKDIKDIKQKPDINCDNNEFDEKKKNYKEILIMH